MQKIPDELMGVPLFWWVMLAIIWITILVAFIYILKSKAAGENSKAMEFKATEVTDYVTPPPSLPPPSKTPPLPSNLNAAVKARFRMVFAASLIAVTTLVLISVLIVYREHQARECEAQFARRAAMEAVEKERKMIEAEHQATQAKQAEPEKPPKMPKERTIVQEALELSKNGTMAFREGDYGQAEDLFRQSLSLIQKAGELGARARVGAYNNLAFALEKQNRDDEAEVYFIMAIREALNEGKMDELGIAHAKQGLIRIHIRQGRLDDVESMYDDAIRIWDVHRGEGNGNSVGLMLDKASFLATIGKSEKAAVLRQQAEKYRQSGGAEAPSKAIWDEDESRHINLSIALKFKPVSPSSKGPNGAWIPGTDTLSPIRPQAIVKEPVYQGIERRYGSMELGIPRHTYNFSLDRSSGPHPVIYFDVNRNGDLSDDGPPVLNEGTGFFSNSIRIPFSQIHERYQGKEYCNILFYMRESDWNGAASHYTQTQLYGTVTIADKEYAAYLAETRINDGDFTNDGIYLDIDQDGTINSQTEHIGFGQALSLDGHSYRFMITP